MRLIPRVIIPLLMFLLLIGYQNFSDPTAQERGDSKSQDWDGETPLAIIHEMQEFQRHDPGLPTELAVPQGGSNLESVRNNWAERQSKILLNGFDKRIEDAVNDKLNSYVRALTQREPADESSKAPVAVQPATESQPAGPATGTVVASAPEVKTSEAPAPEVKKRRNALKFPRPNAIKYEVSDDASFNVIANPGETKLNFSQAYNQRTKVGIEHTTSNQQTQMFLSYDW